VLLHFLSNYFFAFKKKRKQEKRGGFFMAKRKPFGGYSIAFKGCKETLEEVFGSVPLAPSEMTKKLWVFVKKKKLAGK
jgi:hypothetical protein